MATTTSTLRFLTLSSRLAKTVNTSYSRCRHITSATNNGPTAEATPPNPSDVSAKDDVVAKENQDLKSQVEKLEEQMKDSKDKYMRSLAEAENLRRRMVKQVDDAKLFGIQGFCKDLLEVSDILGTAVSSVPKEELNDSNPHLQSLYEGLNMTESQLHKVFKKHGLESIKPEEGDKFDPHFHEALFQVPIQVKETQQPDTVANVQKIGFKLHSRTLRPALVGVFKSS